MEDYNTHVNPHVKRVLQTFQTAAVRSLSGPNGLPFRPGGVLGHLHLSKMSAVEVEEYHKALVATKKLSDEKTAEYDNPFLAPPPFPIQQMPVFTPVDTTKSERSDTVLEGETIACFTVGGEKRLCLPQILNTVLRDFTLHQINAVCDELHIFCSRCNQVQLETLKVLNILPSSAPSCGLITKTDAERLCNALLHSNPERNMEPPSRSSFKVYHECFGKCKGMFNAEAYTSPDAKCIRCCDCYGMFNPAKFVCHSHKSLENRTCHWGFDSANWRSYLLLAKDQNLSENGKLQDAIEEVKSRFDPSHKQKRKQSPERSSRNESSVSKRVKSESGSEASPDVLTPSPTQTTAWEALSLRQLSAFHPWSPSLLTAIKEGKLLPPPAIMRDGLAGILPSYLHTGPPVLLNPERVVPYSESERYERHFTPNVSLAPSFGQKTSPDDEDEDVGDKPMLSQTSITGCLSSESSAQKTSSGSAKFDTVPRDTMEYDISTDTDDSSLASPTDSCKDIRLSDGPIYESTLEREMDMIHSVLEGKVEPTPEAHTRFLQDYSRMRAKTEETVQWLLCKLSVYKRELEAVRRQNIELSELVSKVELEKRNLALEKEYALKEARAQKQQSQMHNKIDQELENQLRKVESLYREACAENMNLRRELTAMSEKSASVRYTNGIDRSLKSRLKMALDSSVSQEGGVANKNHPSEPEVKKERDITVD